jgi:multidrug efflux pump subunit AcrB
MEIDSGAITRIRVLSGSRYTERIMSTFNRCSFGLLAFVLLTGVLAGPVLAQSEESDSDALKKLQDAMTASLDAGSYTMNMDQEIEQKQSMSNMTITQTNKGTVKFEKPYMHVDLTTDVSGMGGKQKQTSQAQEMVGKLGEDDSLQGLFQKKADGDWSAVEGTQSASFKKMFDRFRDPSKLTERLKNVQSAGEETVNGTETLKITAEQREEALKETAKEMLKGAQQNKMIQQMELDVDVKDSKMTVWIRKDSSRIEKIDVDTKQDITMTLSMRGKERSFTMNQDLKMTSTFSDYGSTSIDSKIKDVADRMTGEDK